MLCLEYFFTVIFSSYERIHWQQQAAFHQHCDITQERQWCQWHCKPQQHWWQSHTQYLIICISWQCYWWPQREQNAWCQHGTWCYGCRELLQQKRNPRSRWSQWGGWFHGWKSSFAYPHPLPFHFPQIFYQRLLWHCSSRCNWTPSRGARGQGQHQDITAQWHSAASGPTKQPQYSSQCHWPPCYLCRWHSEHYSGCGQGLGGERDRLLSTAIRRSDRYWREGGRGGPADFLADCGSMLTAGLLG